MASVQSDDERRRITRELFDRWCQLMVDHDMRGWANLWAEDAVFEFPFGPPGYPRLNGREEIFEYIRDFPKLINITGFAIDTIHETSDPDTLVIEFAARGNAVATGDPYEVDYVGVFTVKDGKLARYRDYWNPLAVAGPLGAMETLQDFGGRVGSPT